LKPLKALDKMKKRRQMTNEFELTTGSGRLTEAFGIDTAYRGVDATEDKTSPVIVDGERESSICTGPRVGVDDDRELRFYLEKSDCVS